VTGEPTPAEELAFLGNLRLLLADGAFVSTYKFALLRAIADECVERGATTGALEITVQRLGERFVELYWRQARPFAPANGEAVGGGRQLLQNTGRQAGVIRRIEEECRRRPLLSELRRSPDAWRKLTNDVASTVRKMPLYKLQTIGGRKLEFLYEEQVDEPHVTLKPGVAWLFRKHHGLVRDLVEVAWIRFIQSLPRNAEVLGRGQELGQFLFGTDRETLARVAGVLREVDGARCFYCERTIEGAPHVDHFVPWSRYALDLGHNFVLADSRCNLDKRTWLPAAAHLEKWVERNRLAGPAFESRLLAAGMPSQLRTTLWVAQWAYSVDFASGAASWIKKTRRVEPVREACLEIVSRAIARLGEARPG